MPFVFILLFIVFVGLVYLSLPLWGKIGAKVVRYTNQSFSREVEKDASRQQGRSAEETGQSAEEADNQTDKSI